MGIQKIFQISVRFLSTKNVNAGGADFMGRVLRARSLNGEHF